MRKRPEWKSAAARQLQNVADDALTVREAVKTVAGWVLNDIPCPPTDLEAICPRLNIGGFYPEDLLHSGELRRDGEGFNVIYASGLSLGRRRFTIAHEMGHAIFETIDPNNSQRGEELERICDLLASEILMPTGVFLDHLGKQLSLQKIFELSRVFKTSLTATAIRCSELRQATVFEVEGRTVVWSRGIVKKVGRALEAAIDETMGGHPVEQVVFLRDKPWNLEGVPLGGKKRALFLLQPLPHPSPSISQASDTQKKILPKEGPQKGPLMRLLEEQRSRLIQTSVSQG